MGNPILYIVIPCYNEEAVLPLTSGMFLKKIKDLAAAGKISDKSRILFVNDGSKDKTWDIIRSLAEADEHYRGVCLSRNRGHQNALLAGLMTAKDLADVTISIDCDGQDDINAMDAMIDEYLAGMDVVYGVRSKRETDTWFKRTTAEGFYKVMKALGAEVVFNNADYRLLSKRALEGLAEFREVNLFLRGLVPLVGYRCSSVYYERAERIAGESHYPLKKMLAFAFDGITSLSVKPLRLITLAGMLVSAVSFIAIIVTLITKLVGFTVTGWTSMICAIYFLGGVQLLGIGVIGEYVGKIYNEQKRVPASSSARRRLKRRSHEQAGLERLGARRARAARAGKLRYAGGAERADGGVDGHAAVTAAQNLYLRAAGAVQPRPHNGKPGIRDQPAHRRAGARHRLLRRPKRAGRKQIRSHAPYCACRFAAFLPVGGRKPREPGMPRDRHCKAGRLP